MIHFLTILECFRPSSIVVYWASNRFHSPHLYSGTILHYTSHVVVDTSYERYYDLRPVHGSKLKVKCCVRPLFLCVIYCGTPTLIVLGLTPFDVLFTLPKEFIWRFLLLSFFTLLSVFLWILCSTHFPIVSGPDSVWKDPYWSRRAVNRGTIVVLILFTSYNSVGVDDIS